MAIDDRDYWREDAIKRASYRGNDPAELARYEPRAFRSIQSGAIGASTARRLTSTVLALGAIVSVLYASASLRERYVTAPTAASVVVAPNAVDTAGGFPPAGTVRYYQPVEPSQLVSTLSISVAGGHDFLHVVRIRSVENNRLVVDAYLRPGESMTLGLPAGVFRTEAFVGRRWLGEEALFAEQQNPVPPAAPFVSAPGADTTVSLLAPLVGRQTRSE